MFRLGVSLAIIGLFMVSLGGAISPPCPPCAYFPPYSCKCDYPVYSTVVFFLGLTLIIAGIVVLFIRGRKTAPTGESTPPKSLNEVPHLPHVCLPAPNDR